MSTTTIHEFSRETAARISETLGMIPGKLTKRYLTQSGFAGKWMFWNEETGKYVHMKRGMKIAEMPDGPRLVA